MMRVLRMYFHNFTWIGNLRNPKIIKIINYILQGVQYNAFKICSELFSLLHRACCQVTQLLYQLMHLYKIYTLKH